MKLTNKFNLPAVVVEAIQNDSYDKGDADISITGLAEPPRIRVLKKKYWDKLEEDVSDKIPSFLGRLMHLALERASKEGLAEKRFYAEVDDVWVSGQLDAYHKQGLVYDYKLVPLRKLEHGVPFEYEAQLNCYAALLRRSGMEVNQLQIVAFFKDWFRSSFVQGKTSIPSQCWVFDVEVWSDEKAWAYMRERVAMHKAANKKLPLCTPEDQWHRVAAWAVMIKKGAAKSVKNYKIKEDAEKHAKEIGGFVEPRQEHYTRCEGGWCPVSDFCTQWRNIKKQKE